MSTEDEAVVQEAEKILQGGERKARITAMANNLIKALASENVSILEDLVQGMVDTTVQCLPVFRGELDSDEAGDMVAMAHLVGACRKQPPFILAEALSWAVLQMAKAKLAASNG